MERKKKYSFYFRKRSFLIYKFIYIAEWQRDVIHLQCTRPSETNFILHLKEIYDINLIKVINRIYNELMSSIGSGYPSLPKFDPTEVRCGSVSRVLFVLLQVGFVYVRLTLFWVWFNNRSDLDCRWYSNVVDLQSSCTNFIIKFSVKIISIHLAEHLGVMFFNIHGKYNFYGVIFLISCF